MLKYLFFPLVSLLYVHATSAETQGTPPFRVDERACTEIEKHIESGNFKESKKQKIEKIGPLLNAVCRKVHLLQSCEEQDKLIEFIYVYVTKKLYQIDRPSFELDLTGDLSDEANRVFGFMKECRPNLIQYISYGEATTKKNIARMNLVNQVEFNKILKSSECEQQYQSIKSEVCEDRTRRVCLVETIALNPENSCYKKLLELGFVAHSTNRFDKIEPTTLKTEPAK